MVYDDLYRERYIQTVYSDVLAEIGLRFLADCTTHNIDAHINDSLVVCAQLLGADKAALMLLSEDSTTIARRWIFDDSATNGDALSIWECISQIPANAAWCQNEFEQYGYITIKLSPDVVCPCSLPDSCCNAAIIVPIEVKHQTIGFLEVSAETAHDWQSAHADMCRTLAAILVLQVLRIDQERELEQHAQELTNAVRLATQSIQLTTDTYCAYNRHTVTAN